MRDHLVVRARWAILAALVALCAWILPGLTSVQEDDDVLAFLPPSHPEVLAFREIAGRFGVLEIGLVGIRKAEGDLLSVAAVDEVRELARVIGELPGVRMVLSFTDLPDPKVTEDGLEVAALVPADLRDPVKIREKVLASTDAVGNLISADGHAAALMVFILHDSQTPRTATLQGIRDLVAARWQGEYHVGGAPFVEDAAARASRSDVNRLSPVVIGVLVLVSALPSETLPYSVRKIASSKPLSWASRRASALLRYSPVGLVRAGIALSLTRRHDDTHTSIASLSM